MRFFYDMESVKKGAKKGAAITFFLFFLWGLLWYYFELPTELTTDSMESLQELSFGNGMVHLNDKQLNQATLEVMSLQQVVQTKQPLEYEMEYCVGMFPIKNVKVKVVNPQKVYLGGDLVGIYGETEGVLVLGTTRVENDNGIFETPSEGKLERGDYLLEIDGIKVNEKEKIRECVGKWAEKKAKEDGKAITITYLHKGEIEKTQITPCYSEGEYYLGLWVKDDLAGIGTLTFISKDWEFAALGHGMGDGETGTILTMGEGDIFMAKQSGVVKGQRMEPGSISAGIRFGKETYLGEITRNSSLGIYGTLNENGKKKTLNGKELVEVAYKQAIEKGKAYLVSSVSGKNEAYEIRIIKCNLNEKNSNKGITFEVTDEKLLELTGGVIQGMSGSPIIQNGRLIGAVTHVFIEDPTKGYGIFIEEMLENSK